jgi:hypothetical protein
MHLLEINHNDRCNERVHCKIETLPLMHNDWGINKIHFMVFAFAKYWIDFNGNASLLIKHNEVMLTPEGNIIKHHNKRLVEHILFELECEIELDIDQLSNYTLYAALVDLLTEKAYRIGVINDPVHNAFGGLENIQQFQKWGDLFSDLELLGLDYPDIIQITDIEEVENWIKENGEVYENSINRFINHYCTDLNVRN